MAWYTSPTGKDQVAMTVGFFLQKQTDHFVPDPKSAYVMFWTDYIWVNGYSSALFSDCDPVQDPEACDVGSYVGKNPYTWYGSYDPSLLPPTGTPVTVEATLLYNCSVVFGDVRYELECNECSFINELKK